MPPHFRACRRAGRAHRRTGRFNTRATARLRDACERAGTPSVVHLSSISTYNVAGPEDIRLSEVPAILGRMLGRPVARRSIAPAPGDPRIATVSSERARRELGYAPQVSVADGIAKQLDAWRGADSDDAAAATS